MRSSPVERKDNRESNHQRAGSESVIGGTEVNAEQRQRASQLVRSQTEEEAIGEAFALLQELVDEQEPKPVAWSMQNRLTQACYVYATEQPADPNHIQVPVYTAPPAPEPGPSVPGWLETAQFLTDVTTAAGLLAHGRRDKGLAQRIGDFVYKYRMLEARRNGSEIAMKQPLETLK